MLLLSLPFLSFLTVTVAGKEALLPLILKTLLQLSICTLPLLFPVGTKDEWSFSKDFTTWQKCAGRALECQTEVSSVAVLHTEVPGCGIFFTEPGSWLCICMPMNKLSGRVRLERDTSMCLSGGRLAVTEWLLKQFTSLNFCKISCNAVLVIQLRKQSFALLSRLLLQLLYARCNGH